MRPHLPVLTLFLILVFCAALVHASSLVPNGSFEELDTRGLPVAFTTWVAQGQPEFAIDAESAHTGRRSFRISGDGSARASVNSTIPFARGTYRATLWYRISPGTQLSGVTVRIMVFHGSGSSESDKVNWDMNQVAASPGTATLLQGNNLHVVPDGEPAAGEWHPLEVVFTIPEEVVRLQFNLFNWLGEGTVWYDDLHLEPTTFDWVSYQATRQERELRALGEPLMLEALREEHPRLLMDKADLPRLQELVAHDLQAKAWYAALKVSATNLLHQPPSQYEIPDGIRLLATSRRVLDRVTLLAFVHLMENDMRFAERAWRELEAAARFPDWNPRHFLDTAEMTHAFAIGYDWLYQVWTPEQRDVLRTAIVEMGLEPGLNAYRGSASWVRATHNWNLVCNGGLAMGALAIGDEEPVIAELILRFGLKSVPLAITQFAPDGGWDEGVGYWHYSIRYLIPYIAALESALGSSFGLADTPGLESAGTFPIYLTSPAGITFNFSDSGKGVVNAPEMYWMAQRYEQPSYAWWQNRMSGDKGSVLALLWYARDLLVDFTPATLPLDKHFRHVEVATMRSAWEEKDALFVGLIAGDNNANHGDLDMGQFVLDALGQRWAVDLGADDYNIPGYWGTQRWTYYRKRAEGHNTLVLDPSADVDQDPRGVAHIVFQGAGEGEAVSIADLTPGYQRHALSLKRGIALMDDRSQVLVQDEIETPVPTEVWWFMHTLANITLDVDGTSALLEQGGKRLAVRILAPVGATFTVLPAAPLPTSPNPAVQAVNHNVRKLAIHFTNITNTRIVVQFTPLVANELGSLAPEVKPLKAWQEGLEDGRRLWTPLERIALDIGLPSEALRGVVPITMEWGLPSSERLKQVCVMVDDETLYTGTQLPEELPLDTRSLSDGPHHLTVQAMVEGSLVERTYPFRVANWWQIIDRMEPPIDSGWFGTLIRSKTSSESAGWAYTTVASSTQLGGVDRRIRTEDTEEQLTWETPNLRRIKVRLEAPRSTVESGLRLSISQDGETWQHLPYTTHELGISPEGLHALVLEAELPTDTHDVHWCQLRVLPGHFAADKLQIGQAEFTGLHE